VAFSPDVIVKPRAFHFCLSLQVPAASVGFELDTGVKDWEGRNDPNVGMTSFAKWRNQMDDEKECYKTAMCMIRLCNTTITRSRIRYGPL